MSEYDGTNPCNTCSCVDKGDCQGCVLNRVWSRHGECGNTRCFCNYECGCLLSLDDVCKASDCYISEDDDVEDDDHDPVQPHT